MSNILTSSISYETNLFSTRFHLGKAYLLAASIYIWSNHRTLYPRTPFQLQGFGKTIEAKMKISGSSRTLLAALFVFLTAFDLSPVDANFVKSMYFYWGAQHSTVLGTGDELQLVLDQTSGNNLISIHQFISLYVSVLQVLCYFEQSNQS